MFPSPTSAEDQVNIKSNSHVFHSENQQNLNPGHQSDQDYNIHLSSPSHQYMPPHVQPNYPPSNYVQPNCPPSNYVQTNYPQSNYVQPNYPPSNYPQSTYPQYNYPQSNYSQQNASQNQLHVATQKTCAEVLLGFPALAWYVCVSFFLYWLFNFVSTCLSYSLQSLVLLLVQGFIISLLIYFVYRVVRYEDDAFTCCRNFIVFIFACGIISNLIFVFYLDVEMWKTIFIVALSINLVGAIIAKYVLFHQKLSHANVVAHQTLLTSD
jgi:hypothetical protein